MRFRGRVVDPIALWSEYVDFPANMQITDDDEFTPLVQCPNPEHGTTKRHFQINVRKPLVHCFANCGISGTYERAISMIEGVSHRQARKTILRHSRVGPDKKYRKRKSATAISPDVDLGRFDTYLPQVALEYLASRGISSSSTARWGLLWDAEERRIVIPVRDARERVRLTISRAVLPKQHPKYLYSTESERNRLLYGHCEIDLGMVRSEGIVLVEGSVDTILQHQDGFTNTGGILGSYLSEIQARIVARMRPPRIYCMYDADAAGVGALISTAKLLRHIPIFVVRYPIGKDDPAELTRKERYRAIERAISLAKFRQLTGTLTRQPERKSSFG